MLNIFYNPFSTFATKVLYFAEESGKPFKLTLIELAKREQDSAEFRKLNFASKVPVIDLDGFILGESSAIIRYLAQKWELEAWYPRNLEDRARVDQLADYTHQHISSHIATLAWHRFYAPIFRSPVNHGLIQHADSLLKVSLPKIDGWLEGRHYLSSYQPSIADAMLLPFVDLYKEAEINLNTYRNLQSWHHRMSERPAWIKTKNFLAAQQSR